MIFKNRLFDIIDDEPVINVVIVNLGPFNKLYKADKTESKSKYKAQLQYCYYMGDYSSPIFNMEEGERRIQACDLCFGNKNVVRHITKLLEEALLLFKKCQSTVERRTLESTINSCDSLNDNLNNMRTSSDLQLKKLLDELDVEIKNSTGIDEKIELFSTKQNLEQATLANNKIMSDLIVKASKTLDTIEELRQKANKAHSELEDTLSDFIIDEFILDNQAY